MPMNVQRGEGPAGFGELVLRFANSPDPIREIRALSPLPDEAQRMIDTAVVEVGTDRLSFVADLMSEGLTTPIPNWMSVLEMYWERVNQTGRAQRSMLPGTRGENQHTDHTGRRIPVYCTWDDFSYNARMLAAAARAGLPLDTAGVAQATRNVNEAIEDAAINGAGIVESGNDTPGLLTAPNAATYPIDELWTLHTPAEIVADVRGMAAELEANKRFGPYNLYVPRASYNELQEDYTTTTANIMTTLGRLEMLQYGGRPLRIRPVDYMPVNKVAMVQMTKDVVDVLIGQEPATLRWSSLDGMHLYFLVLACIVPRFRDDYEGNSGIVIGTMAT